MEFETSNMSRRQVVVGAGVGTLAAALSACGSGGEAPAEQPAESPEAGASAGESLVKVADVPVGSGVVLEDLVVTQPTPGAFTGLSNVCTHKGCKVSEVAGGEIVCPCHGSRFGLDGSVVKGPATEPLKSRPVAVEGDEVVLT